MGRGLGPGPLGWAVFLAFQSPFAHVVPSSRDQAKTSSRKGIMIGLHLCSFPPVIGLPRDKRPALPTRSKGKSAEGIPSRINREPSKDKLMSLPFLPCSGMPMRIGFPSPASPLCALRTSMRRKSQHTGDDGSEEWKEFGRLRVHIVLQKYTDVTPPSRLLRGQQ